jgi:hypothetical protein
MMSRASRIWAGTGLLLALGCAQLSGGSNRYVRTAPAESELVGVWRADQASLTRLAGEGGKHAGPADHFFELKADHSGAFHSTFSYPEGPFITDHTCTWKISTATAYVHHMRIEAPAVELRLEKGHSITIAHYYIVREGGHLVLRDFIGDPDYEVYMDFVKS